MRINTFVKYLATGMMPVDTDTLDEAVERYYAAACDETLEEHDKKYHPDGYKVGDTCNKRDAMSENDNSDNVEIVNGKGDIDDAFKITSSRIKPNGEAFDYHKYGMAYAERQPIKIDGRAFALADHLVDGALRELAGESSDINKYYLFFNGGVFGNDREIENITGVRPGDSDSETASVLEFDSEKELLAAYDKLNKSNSDAFEEEREWTQPEGTPSGVNSYKIKRDFYDAVRQKSNGQNAYVIDNGIGILRNLTDQELDDFAWTYNIGKYEKGKGNGEKSALAKAVERVMKEREENR